MTERPDHLRDRLLALPSMAAYGETLRASIGAMPGAGSPLEPADEGVLVDTLGSLALLGSDAEVAAAAIVDVVPAWHAPMVARMPGLPALVDGLRAARQVWSLHAEHAGEGNPEGLRRLLLALVRDLRVVLVLLARQLAMMRAAARTDADARQALALLTRDIHAPLANRLGIWQLKWELEDLAFRYLEPDVYRRIASLLDDTRAGREGYVATVRTRLDEALAAQGIRAEVAGRPKHIYSIWRKMQKKQVPIGELYDLRAVRILVDDVPACYAALGVVHALWTPVPSEFDDYIARPKNNDYRSLHTAVLGPEGKTLEVQIRTREMHEASELGVAAHWRYKETGGSQRASSAGSAALERRIEWMRRLLEAHADPGRDDSGALADALGTELAEDRVFVLTPKGEVIDLPRGATPLDFAYHVHTMVGHRCRGAKVDGRIVPLDYALHSGERVEILTAKTPAPRRDWLVAANGFLASPRSREKVRTWFHKLDRERNVQAGRELLEKDLRRLGLLQADLAPVLGRFNVATVDDLHVLVALGDVGPNQVGRALLELERERAAPSQAPAPALPLRRPRRAPRTGDAEFRVVGVDNLLVQTARCCRPVPGEPIAGYLTRARGVTVHRRDCPSFLRLSAGQPQRVLPVEWGGVAGGHESDILVEAIDRKHLLKDISNLIAQEDVHVLSIQSDHRALSRVQLRLRLRVGDYGQLARLLGKLDSLPGVEQARRS
ncbi:bifunctional (p)ppGpp synthetase/guanosine-3',5'-bis(diphosphate) 3'-pyrophosphohydrolase [Luteimonas sp. WGS1318]|uniref:bifunctional (p)ppGpp synthetase/guanosine-3',5'-bis(diphosphate) 3'-pyrophosphohydrolase n=1 Tax=Luteimonas sp. WGS1318 TaxID=3366815 RepID=UPI00372D2E91